MAELQKKPKTKRKIILKNSSEETDELNLSPNGIVNDLKKQGIELFTNDNILDEFLRLPADITELTSRDLGKYFNTFTKQKMWTRTLLSLKIAENRDLNSSLDIIKAELFSELPMKMSIKEKELNLYTYVSKSGLTAKNMLEKQKKLEGTLDILNSYLENLNDGIFSISREISRRESDFKDDKRESNLK